MNYWYFEQPDEILLDCDRGFDRVDAEHVLRIWKREFHEHATIQHVYSSRTIGHKHVVIATPGMLPTHKRLLSLMLGSDRHRELLSFSQWMRVYTNPFLVISPRKWPGRAPNFTCTCTPCDRTTCSHFDQIQKITDPIRKL